MEEKKLCPICGEPTFKFYGNYRKDGLCSKHATMLKNGELTVNDDGKFTFTNEKEANIEANDTSENKESECIICKNESNGKLFCKKCYHLYKNKELLIKIKNCTEISVLDESYEGIYTCEDGHIVKSKSEVLIDNYLSKHGISHAYEKEISYGKNDNETLHPDFCLIDYLGKDKPVYLEHWGYAPNSDNLEYQNRKDFKIEKYKKLGITLVCTHEDTDISKIDAVLDRRLKKDNIDENKINFDKE